MFSCTVTKKKHTHNIVKSTHSSLLSESKILHNKTNLIKIKFYKSLIGTTGIIFVYY
ncbi:hypothetical protein FWK35_00008579, partial [Aphis craccivora]